MVERIITGWSFQRALYLLIGVYVIVQSSLNGEWLGVVFGSYFAAMGLFALGCASGTCYMPPQPKKDANVEAIEFEEIKKK